MGFLRISSWLVLVCWVFALLCFRAGNCNGSEISVKFLKAPYPFSHLKSAIFEFQVMVGPNEDNCTDCSINCTLDNFNGSDCEGKKVSYTSLEDGNHTLEICSNSTSQGFGCSSYNWTIDTIPPTATIVPSTSFTNSSMVSVNISFTEPCNGGGGFQCSSQTACNLLVYGAGQVIPSSFKILEPNLKYSLLVALSSAVQYGRVILVMDRNFCSDSAGNIFTRTSNSSFYVHFDRRSVFVDLRTHVPEKLLQLNSETRTVQATNNNNNLKVYLYFSVPIVNSSAEILNSLNINGGSLLPTGRNNLGNRKFGFMVSNVSEMAIITVSVNSNSIISRQGTPISPVSPVTFLYDSHRPTVMLSTRSYARTKEQRIPILIKFLKPVFDFNSSHVSISGGHLMSFRAVSRSVYSIEVQADNRNISISVPENVTTDVAGNKNLPSNVLQVMHYSVPLISSMVSKFTIASFTLTSLVASLLTVSTASLQSAGAFMGPSSLLTSEPTRNLFRIASHIQVYALSRWLAVTLPVEYYEFSRGLQWSIPFFNLPWEAEHIHPVLVGSGPSNSLKSYLPQIYGSENFQSMQPENEDSFNKASQVYGLPLSPMEYRLFFVSQNMKPQAEYIWDAQNSMWKDFDRIMFWLAVIGGGLVVLHMFFLFILKYRKKMDQKKSGYGALTFPRFEIFLMVLALPCISAASGALIAGGELGEVIVGVLMLGIVSFLLLFVLLFLSIGITFGKLLQYKEVHKEGQKFHWYQELIRVTLGPGKRGQWTWKNRPNSVYLTMFGPLFEDLRGPPKYMLSQISESTPHKHSDWIMASEDENEDAEAPFIQKVFGILRIYYMLLESIRRVMLGIFAGFCKEKWFFRTPTITLLAISSFQLFFLVLKKPFIKKKVQLVEIISVLSEVCLFTTCLVLSENEISITGQTKLGIFMVILFLASYSSQMVNEWYALWKQIKRLDPNKNSFLSGLKLALIGFVIFFLPRKITNKLESKFIMNDTRERENQDIDSLADRCRSSGSRSSSTDKPWLKQLRELAKASFSKEGGTGPSDPSCSTGTKWSGVFGMKMSESSKSSSSEYSRSKPKGLYKDLESIFASR